MNQKSAPVARLYGLCSSADHHTDLCPFVQQSEAIEQPEAYAANIYNRPPQPQQQNQPQKNNYDLSRNRYNPGWRNHPNLRWSNPPQQQPQQQPIYSLQNQNQNQISNTPTLPQPLSITHSPSTSPSLPHI